MTRTFPLLTAGALVAALVLTGCAGSTLGEGASTELASPTSAESSPTPSEPHAAPTTTTGGTPGAPGSDVMGGDGDEPAPMSELSTQVGRPVRFEGTVTEVVGAGTVAVSAPEGGEDPVLVYGALAPADAEVGASVAVDGTVEVFDAARARARHGEGLVPAGLERFDGTPAVLVG